MTALRREAIQLVEQIPEDQIAYVIQSIQTLINSGSDHVTSESSKMQAFMELERMLVPQEIDYDKELAEARDERYGCFN